MGVAIKQVGKYCLGGTVGKGMFAKVKIAVNVETNERVAVKIIDKPMVLKNQLMHQVKSEISTMKRLNHPNIVKIHEVLATKTKIYLVMEYVSGGQLSEKMSHLLRLSEQEARKYFQQLIDAVDYCHERGVYHRDLKPENLLLDNKGNLKISDFGLSALPKQGDMLSTACGSPSYVAPEVISNKKYEGAAADVWSCGIILFELLAGYLPFEDRSLTNLYRKAARAEYSCPDWFTEPQTKLLSNILNPIPRRRAKIKEILADEWFQIDYKPSAAREKDESMSLDSSRRTIDSMREGDTCRTEGSSGNFINAFQLISMSKDLDLSGLFQEEKTKFASTHPIDETIQKIEVVAQGMSLSVQRLNNSKVKLHENTSSARCQSSTISAEVIQVTPTHCMVEVSKPAGELTAYKEFCNSLSSLLKNSGTSSDLQPTTANERRGA